MAVVLLFGHYTTKPDLLEVLTSPVLEKLFFLRLTVDVMYFQRPRNVRNTDNLVTYLPGTWCHVVVRAGK